MKVANRGYTSRFRWPRLATLSAMLAPSDTSTFCPIFAMMAAPAINAGDNAWMLVSTALVLLMTGPGLALFYGGLVRRKNVLSMLMQSFTAMALVTVLWVLIGYSLGFAPGNALIGGLHYVGLRGVGALPNPAYAPTIPQTTFMAFEMMFAIITPALITGAFAERMKYSALLLFIGLWSLVVYSPMAHMVWGVGGWLSLGGSMPTLDFAGGTVVHITSGVSALVCALYLGRRIGYPREPMPPHNLVLSLTGACLLWVGWFGFNAGSALNAGGLASAALVATQVAAAAAALIWAALEWWRSGTPSALGAISGAVAGLVAITPAAGYVTPLSALVIGALAGAVCFFMVTVIKSRLGYDDALDAFGVHGIGGTLGALLTGVFATRWINPALGPGAPLGGVDGHWAQILHQLLGVVVAWVWAAVATLGLLWLVDRLIGLRVSREYEIEGLDVNLHGEEGYHFE